MTKEDSEKLSQAAKDYANGFFVEFEDFTPDDDGYCDDWMDEYHSSDVTEMLEESFIESAKYITNK